MTFLGSERLGKNNLWPDRHLIPQKKINQLLSIYIGQRIRNFPDRQPLKITTNKVRDICLFSYFLKKRIIERQVVIKCEIQYEENMHFLSVLCDSDILYKVILKMPDNQILQVLNISKYLDYLTMNRDGKK